MDATGTAFGKNKTLFSVSCNPASGESMSRADFDRVRKKFEQEYQGLESQPVLIIEHHKKGRVHQHWLYALVTEDGKTINTWNNYARDEKIARIAEYDLGQSFTLGKFNRSVMAHLKQAGREDVIAWMQQHGAHEKKRPLATKTFKEHQQEQRTKITIEQVKQDLKAAYETTDSGKAFEAAIAEKGYLLARGDKRDFVVVDSAGGVHSPRRRLGVKVKDLRSRWADLKPEQMPTVSEVQNRQKPRKETPETKLFLLQQEREQVRQEMAFLQQQIQEQRIQKQHAEQTRFTEIAKTSKTLSPSIKSGDDTDPGRVFKNSRHISPLKQDQKLSGGAENASQDYRDQRQEIADKQIQKRADQERAEPRPQSGEETRGIKHGRGFTKAETVAIETFIERYLQKAEAYSYQPDPVRMDWAVCIDLAKQGTDPASLRTALKETSQVLLDGTVRNPDGYVNRTVSKILKLPEVKQTRASLPPSCPVSASRHLAATRQLEISYQQALKPESKTYTGKDITREYDKGLARWYEQRGKTAFATRKGRRLADRQIAIRLIAAGHSMESVAAVIARQSPHSKALTAAEQRRYGREVVNAVKASQEAQAYIRKHHNLRTKYGLANDNRLQTLDIGERLDKMGKKHTNRQADIERAKSCLRQYMTKQQTSTIIARQSPTAANYYLPSQQQKYGNAITRQADRERQRQRDREWER